MSGAATATLDTTTLAPGLSAKVIEQVAYYLSPSNLQRDAFLATKVREGGGFVHATLLAGFPRVKSLVDDAAAICSILWNCAEFNCKGAAHIPRIHDAVFAVTRAFSIRLWRCISRHSSPCHAYRAQGLRRRKARSPAQRARQNVLCRGRPARS